jgi:hypothetical protein
VNSWMVVLLAIVGSLALAWVVSEALVRLRIGPTDRGGDEAS